MSFNSVNQMPRLNMIPKFYQEVVIGFSMANKYEIVSKSDLFNQIIWGNQNFMVDGKCLYSKTFIESGFVYVYDILENNGKFKSNIYEYLNNKHNYLHTIHMIQTALKPYKKQRFSIEPINQVEAKVKSMDNCKTLYKHIIKRKSKKSKAIKKWSEFFDDEINWSNVFNNKLCGQYDPNILDFNFKLLNNLLPTKYNLMKWKK